jgi:death-on-curing protein
VNDAWRWVALDVVLAVHDRQIAEHGGLDGMRDAGLLESALARPQQRLAYDGGDAADLAACYLWAILRHHPFADGNKRTGWVVARIFLLDNDRHMHFMPVDAIRIVERAAAGSIDEGTLAQWFRERIA